MYDTFDYDSIYGDVMVIEGLPFIRREIDDKYYDLCSVYPFTYNKILNVPSILEKLENKEDCVSLTVISNPLVAQPERLLGYEQIWFHYCKEFKTHFYVNLSKASRNNYTGDKKRNLKKFYKKGNEGIVEVIPQAAITERLVERCFKTYEALQEKHNISPTAFSYFDYESFRKQFFVNNCVLLVARDAVDFAGWALFHRRDNNMYYHLSATSAHGYKISSSYAILDTAIGLFKQLGFTYLLLGSGAGVDSNPDLEYFKDGWGCYKAKNYIYGWINNTKVYERLSRDKAKDKPFFPLYRR